MSDFPSKDYFGDKASGTFEKLLEKRFCADLLKNHNDFTAKNENGYSLLIEGTSNKRTITDEFSELKGRLAFKEYAEKCYKEPEQALKSINGFLSEREKLADEIHYAVNEKQKQSQNFVDVQVFEYPRGNVYSFTNSKGESTVFDERFDEEMRKNYNMPLSIQECLVTLGATEQAAAVIVNNLELEKTNTNNSDLSIKASEELKNSGITLQIDSFEKGNVYVFTTPDGKTNSFDERFDNEMRKYYNMPLSIDECLKALNLSDEEINQCKEQYSLSEDKKEPEIQVNKATEKDSSLPFPEEPVIQPVGKIKEEKTISEADSIAANIANQIKMTR